jgi:hypothetical protein
VDVFGVWDLRARWYRRLLSHRSSANRFQVNSERSHRDQTVGSRYSPGTICLSVCERVSATRLPTTAIIRSSWCVTDATPTCGWKRVFGNSFLVHFASHEPTHGVPRLPIQPSGVTLRRLKVMRTSDSRYRNVISQSQHRSWFGFTRVSPPCARTPTYVIGTRSSPYSILPIFEADRHG